MIENIDNYFEERAENLSRSEIARWTADTPRGDIILKKLTGPGSKLLSGPRGCGKSTYFRSAYFKLSESDKVFPIYVNYSKSLALEPLFHTNANALILFRQWLLCKIVCGMEIAIIDCKEDMPDFLNLLVRSSKIFIETLEKGLEPTASGDDQNLISIDGLKRIIDKILYTSGRGRCVLLLDDAAHAFSQEQQREFFEIFRELSSRGISPKAAVYPGVTSYSKNFHIGHDAELVEAWADPDDEKYLDMMWNLIKKRFPSSIVQILLEKPDLSELLAYASFGIPRAFLNSVAAILDGESNTTNLTRSSAFKAIGESSDAQRGTFKSLARKLPRYEEFVSLGEYLLDQSVGALRQYNRLIGTSKDKAREIAIEDTTSATFDKVIQLLQYAGIIREAGTVSRGVKGRFCRYSIHSAILLHHTAFSIGRSFSVKDVVDIFKLRNPHAFVRRRESSLVGDEKISACRLRLPGCKNCGAERLNDLQRFCASCGAELTTASVYKELLGASIDELPITSAKREGIRNHTALRTIQDILGDESGSLRNVPRIGVVWQSRIKNAAEEFVSV